MRRKNMHWKCKLFGHKYDGRIKSQSFFVADNYYCCRCRTWSYDFPSQWFDRWGNGIVPDTFSHLRGLWISVSAYVHWMKEKVIPSKPPF